MSNHSQTSEKDKILLPGPDNILYYKDVSDAETLETEIDERPGCLRRRRCRRLGRHMEQRRKSPLRRLIRFIVFSFGFWFVLTRVFSGLRGYMPWAHHHHMAYHLEELDCATSSDWVSGTEGVPRGGLPELDVPGTIDEKELNIAHTSFEVPVDAPGLSVFTQGFFPFNGNVDLITDPTQDKDKVIFYVVARYADEGFLERAKVCSVEDRGGRYGVGIFLHGRHRRRFFRRPPPGSPPRRPSTEVFFEIVVSFPENEDGTPININQFESAGLAHTISYRTGDLNKKVHFGRIHLLAHNAPVSVGTLSATSISVKNGLQPVTGVFNGSQIIISSHNAPIAVDVGLIDKGDGQKPFVNLHTGNAPIDGRISLFNATRSEDHQSTYSVHAVTANADLTLEFPSASTESTLFLAARTSNGNAEVSLHPSFQGFFSVSTSNAQAEVKYDESVEDPAGKGRKRHVDYFGRNGSDKLRGTVHWEGDKENAKGDAVVSSSNGNAILRL